MITWMTASLSSYTYNKASWREDWTFWGSGINVSQYIDLPLKIMIFVNIIIRLLDLSETWETFPKTETIRSHISRAGKPSNLKPVAKDNFRFCWTVWNWSLFLAHPTYWNKCMTSENAQRSSRSGFRIFKISLDIRVLKVPVGRMRSSIWITHENCEGSSFFDPEDKEFRGTIKNACKKLETPVVPAMPCKIMKKNCGSGESNKSKTKLACDESTRMRMENSIPNHHEDHIAGKETINYSITIFHKLIDSYASNYEKFMQQTQRWTRNGKKWRISAWNLTKVRSNKSSDRWSEDEGRKSVFCITDGHTSFEKCWIGGKNTKTPRWYCKRWFCVSRSFHWTRIISISAANVMDIISRLAGCDGQTAYAVSAYTLEMEDAHKLLKIPKSECPDIWIRLPRHKWPTSWSSIEDPVVAVERNLYGHPSAGLMGKASCEDPFEAWLGENSKLECLFVVHREKRIILINICVER